ncbi:helix-turn-helix domain-containing protein [Solirubrobacter soli]|uniref:helix-turn-helix domain-containing protein n=1 Tax=Solirubrobacter soli TaxID=363832 RepID=UPI00040D250F|nr:helix-turn-helix domain-containing protein [Solirubrobacter soli]
MSDRTAVFLRLTTEQADRLDQAATALRAHKKDLVGNLVDRYIDPADLTALREWMTPVPAPSPRRVTVDLGTPGPVVGHADFRPAEVLDTAGAADLLRVDEAAIVELATKGELPGRKIGDQWRFSRTALLSWLG